MRTVLLLAVLAVAACGSKPKDENIVIVHVGSGIWADANLAAYVKPFEQATGIKVVGFADDPKISQLKLMHDADGVEIDVISLTGVEAARAAKLGLLADVDYSAFAAEELSGLERTRKSWGAPSLFYSMVIAYDTRRFPPGAAPQSWPDFWNVERFPGPRTLYTGQYGDGPYEEALLADGVPLDKIYPLDIDRVFRSLDRIRPHIKKWWRVGSEGQQLLRDREVELGGVYDGRVADLKSGGASVDFTYQQGKLLIDYWVIPKRAPHAANAQKFVEFATRAKQQAIFAQKVAYGPANLNAYAFMPEERARQLPSHPDNLAHQIVVDPEWYVQVGPDGVANMDRLINRWSEWILE